MTAFAVKDGIFALKWVSHNVAPPIGDDLIALTLDQNTNVWSLERDNYGNALGGIRLPQHEVPTATNTGINFPGAGFCRTFGTYMPFDAATLRALYADHQTYLELVIKATHSSQQDGFMLGADAAATIRDAATSNIGRPD